MEKNNSQDNLRVTLAIGFIGIILTSLYLLKEYYVDKNGLFIDIFKILVNIYGVFLIIGFLVYLVLKAATLKYNHADEIHDFKISNKIITFVYDNSVDNFVFYTQMAIYYVLIQHLTTFLEKYMSKFWSVMASLGVILVGSVLLYVGFKYFSFWAKNRKKKNLG
ncbi:hypothetical protein HY495_01580 [Candidatus Woesearchaeota archaeon]|nr:hypothetical protein [Candidatus Woesearchaeota archaeon]